MMKRTSKKRSRRHHSEAFEQPSSALALRESPALYFEPAENPPMSGGTKIAIGVAVLAALGIGAYFIFKPKAAAGATGTTGGVAGLPAGVGQIPVRSLVQHPLVPIQPRTVGAWYPIASSAVAATVPVRVQSDFANWYNGSGARPQPLPASMPAAPAAWTESVMSQGRVLYFAAGLQNGLVQWWQYSATPLYQRTYPAHMMTGGMMSTPIGVGQHMMRTSESGGGSSGSGPGSFATIDDPRERQPPPPPPPR